MGIVLICIIYGILPVLFYNKIYSKFYIQLKPIIPFVVLAISSNVYELLGTLLLKWNAKYWFFFYDILSFVTIYYFYYEILNRQYKSLFVLSIFLFTLITLLLLCYSSLDAILINTIFTSSLQTLFVLVFSMFWFIKLFRDANVENLFANSNFYFISGFIIYYCGTLFLFLFGNYFYKESVALFHEYWILNIILNIVLTTFLLLGLWKAQKN
jgi:hypothetical protein